MMTRRSLGFLQNVPQNSRRLALGALRSAGLIASVVVASSCHTPLDTTRQAPPIATLGDDIYGFLCDRVGASSLVEDITGSSYHAICHYDVKGRYGDAVDTSGLPPARSVKSKEARRLAVAKLEAMARRRGELIRAINAVFPEDAIDNPVTEKTGDTIPMHEALMSFGQALTPLYETNPFGGKEPLMPSTTRALGRLFAALQDSPEARDAMSRMWGRQGYRPLSAVLGAVRSALSYPDLRGFTKTSVALLGPGGVASPELQQLLTVVKAELEDSSAVVAPLPTYVVDAATAQPNRALSNSEMAALVLMRSPDSQDPVFAASPSEPERFISLRDRRGFVLPIGGAVQSPFVDNSPADGFADVDVNGRFVDASLAPLALDPPFFIPGVTMSGPIDPFGRPLNAPYAYVDTSRTLARGLARDLLPLLDATQVGAPGDPSAWQSEYEGLMYMLGGAFLQYGPREPAQYDYATDTIHKATDTCVDCLPYSRFRGEDSPIPDLVHALGQVLADKDSDAILLSLIDLFENHEQAVARLLGAALKVQEISKAHDVLAAQGKEPHAQMPYSTPIWDEMATVIDRILAEPGLATKLLGAIADSDIVTPHGTSQHMGDTLARFIEMRDEMTYNQSDINGPAENLTTGGTGDPQTPVDRTPPLAGGLNRSCFQRSLQTIHDANGVVACNKDGADVHIDLGFINVVWPLFGFYDECELFTFDDLASFYLGSILPASHPKRSYLSIKDDALQWIVDTGNSLGLDANQLFEQSSGITGMTLKPTSAALNRLVFFGTDSDVWSMTDRDNVNAGSVTDTFVSSLIEPVSTPGCPKVGGVNHCSAPSETLRLRDGATSRGGSAKKNIFLWERLGFYDYLRPVVTVFANVACSEDVSVCDTSDYRGEKIFIDMIEILHRHWAGPEHGAECSETGTAKTNPTFCSGAGINTYEPILAEAFKSDLIPALHEFAIAAHDLSKITVARGPKAGTTVTGAEVLEVMTKILFDTTYASAVGMVDRAGNHGTTWVDGTPQAQVTTYSLFADALHKIDTRWDTACDAGSTVPIVECQADAALRKGQWKRARSQFVDQFLAVSGEGTSAQFKNPSLVKTSVAALRGLRAQLNANCPNRESGEVCNWAKRDLGQKMSDTISGPLFAAMMDLQEAIRKDEPARRELSRFASYMLGACSVPSAPSFCPQANAGNLDPLQATLASAVDILQILSNDDNMAPIFNAVSTMANPETDSDPGMADTTIKALTALSGDTYDKYHVLDTMLPALVTPMDGGAGPSPIEVFIDTIADVDRIDASSTDALVPADYEAIMRTVSEFMSSETRGMEQFYFIVQNRPAE